MKEALVKSGKKNWDGYGWDTVHVQINEESNRDPLLSSGSVGTAANKKGIDHPINYGVPSFGVD